MSQAPGHSRDFVSESLQERRDSNPQRNPVHPGGIFYFASQVKINFKKLKLPIFVNAYVYNISFVSLLTPIAWRNEGVALALENERLNGSRPMVSENQATSSTSNLPPASASSDR